MNYITKIYISAIFLIGGLTAIQIQAAPFELDTAFGNGGKVVTAVNEHHEWTRRVRIQPDGKIVTLGFLRERAGGFSLVGSFIVRHNANGTLDTSFGTNGATVFELNSSLMVVSDFVVLPDGKLLAIGTKYVSAAVRHTALFRFNGNGSLDTAFGVGGVITTQIGNLNSEGRKIILQSDGKIVVAAIAFSNNDSVGQSAVLRYNPNGLPDGSFGANGIFTIPATVLVQPDGFVEPNQESIGEILIQPDSKILIAGSVGAAYSQIDFMVVRLNPSGTLDGTFGNGGFAFTSSNPNDENFTNGMALQSDGKIVINGINTYLDFGVMVSSAIVRFNANGTLDNSFSGGIINIGEPINTEHSRGLASALTIQPNGKILTAGMQNGVFALSRYNTNGTLDNSFGTNGILTTAPGNNSGLDTIFSLAWQPDGKLVAAGSVRNSSFNYDVGLVRYFVNTTPFDFDGDRRADISVFRSSDRIWYLNQSTNGFSAAQFGLANDKLAPADYDGDGKTDIAVFRDGLWYLLGSSNNQVRIIQFGIAADKPAPADFDGDGKAELAVLRSNNDTWYVLNLVTNQFYTQYFYDIDTPVIRDYDGDGKADLAMYINDATSYWIILQSSTGSFRTEFLGVSTDQPVPADYDGDGKADVAVFHPANRSWLIRRSIDGVLETVTWGLATDKPVPADYDGDGKTDIAIYRNGVWWIRQSSNGLSVQQFGLAQDKPIPAAYLVP